MGKLFLVFMGGSGARSLQAFIWNLVLGLYHPFTEIHILIVDSHRTHKDRVHAGDLIKQYNDVRKVINHNGNFTICKPEIIYYDWNVTPMNDELRDLANLKIEKFCEISLDGNHCFEKTDEAKLLLDALYSSYEQGITVPQGYRAHPSIGATFSGGSILYNKKRLDNLPENVARQQIGDYDLFCKSIRDNLGMSDTVVYYIGSLFGGTGAACMSSISRHIHRMSKEVTNGQGHRLLQHAVFLTPYFSFDSVVSSVDPAGSHDSIDPANFPNATKIALDYYWNRELLKTENTPDSVFDSVYVLGCHEREAVEEYDESDSQSHRPHLVELEVAMAIHHSLYSKALEQEPYRNTFYRNVECVADQDTLAYAVGWNSLKTSTVNPKYAIGDFMILAIMHNTYWLPAAIDKNGNVVNKSTIPLLHDYICEMGERKQAVADIMSRLCPFFNDYLSWCASFAASITGGKGTRLFNLDLLAKWQKYCNWQAQLKGKELRALRQDIPNLVTELGERDFQQILHTANSDLRMRGIDDPDNVPGIFYEILINAISGKGRG